MNRIVLAVLLLLCFQAQALDTPISSGGNKVPSSTVTNYSHATGNTLFYSTVESDVRNVIPFAGTAKDFAAAVATAPAAGKSWAFTLMKNGAATSITCTISGTATTCTDTVNTTSLVAGDVLSIRSIPTGTPTSPVNVRQSWTFSGGARESVILGSSRTAAFSTVSTQYGGLQGSVGNNATLYNRDQVFPTAGTLSSLYVDLVGVAGAGASYVITLNKNGTDQTLTCTISGAAATTCNDTINSFSVVAGDLVAIKVVPSAGPAPTARVGRWGVKWAPTTDGEAVLMVNSGGSLNTAGLARYTSIQGSSNLWQSSEAPTHNLGSAFTLKSMYIALNGAPGGAASYTFRSRKNAANGALVVTVSAAATTGSDTTNSDTIAALDLIDASSLSAGTPTARIGKLGFVAYTAPSGSTLRLLSSTGVGQ